MQLPKIAIKNSQFIFILTLIALIIGIRSFQSMPRTENAEINVPLFNIFISYPGTSPEDMEHLVVNPIEEALNDLDDVTKIEAWMGEGVGNIFLEASFAIDPEEKYDEILRTVTEVSSELPKEIAAIKVVQFKPTDQAVIFQYALVAESSNYKQLAEQGEFFKSRLKKVKGVKKVDIEAVPEEEIRISLDFQRMSRQHITLQQVVQALSANNVNMPGGAVNAANKTFSVSTNFNHKGLKDIQETIIVARKGQIVYLKDIATVAMDYADQGWIARFNQENAIWVNVKMKNGANILQVATAIKKVEAKFAPTLPPNIRLATAYEQASAVKEKIDSFSINLLQGMVLVGAIILLFIGWRAAVIIITTIPLCILIGLAILNGSGFALQQVSIAGLILSLGLLVDNGIVVIESIDRYLKEGFAPKEAAIKGTSDVGFAIISSTATTILAFFPLTQLGMGGGEMIKALPLTVTLTLLISLVLSLTLSPILASKIMRTPKKEQHSFIERFLETITNKVYRPTLHFCLRFGWLVLALAIALLVFSVSLFPKIGVSLLPPADKPMVLINVSAPKGTNLNSTDKAVRYVEQILDTIPYVKSYATNIGHSNPQVYFNRQSIDFESYEAQLLVNFDYWEPQQFYKTINQLRQIFKQNSNARIKVIELKMNTTNTPIEFVVIGNHQDTLKKISKLIATKLKETPGIINVTNPLEVDKTGLNIQLNKEKAGLINLSAAHFNQTIRASLSGLSIGEVSFSDGKDYEMMLRMPFDKKPTINDFNQIYFTTNTGYQVPFSQVARVQFKSLKPQILHKNLERFNWVRADVVQADQTLALTQQINDRLQQLPLPTGYSIVPAGELAEQEALFGNLGTIFILILFGIFAILVLQFRSVLQPIAVFSAIPFATSGSFIALYLTGWPFSFFGFIGFISLSGIVVNDSILIVDQINQLRAQGMERLAAIQLGSERRLVPVVLTTLTTIIGLVPLACSQSNLWTPICATIIGGMLSATLMILLIVPVLYKWFTK